MTRLATLKPRLQTAETTRVNVITSDSWRSGKTTTERGYGYRWQKAREAHLRQHPLCAMCETQGRVTAATVVDHKTPHRGDQALFWNQANWQSLCATHHSSDKQIEEKNGEPRTRFDADGRVIWGPGA
jgi:5-methylcytosine-specific restriction protein A